MSHRWAKVLSKQQPRDRSKTEEGAGKPGGSRKRSRWTWREVNAYRGAGTPWRLHPGAAEESQNQWALKGLLASASHRPGSPWTLCCPQLV